MQIITLRKPLTTRILFCISFQFLLLSLYGQGIRGRITDLRNNPVPFAAVYDEITRTGTTSNTDGCFELKLGPGEHTVVFRALGYTQAKRQVSTNGQPVTLTIQLKEQIYDIKEVVVREGKEDPAYAIMRRAIGLAPYHLNQVKEYEAEVYLRGTIQILHVPKIITKYADEEIKDGDTFLEESINQIRFSAPDTYEQRVKSYRSTSPDDNSNVNPMAFINASFYQPEITEFLSPLAPNAFTYYTYRYEGFFEEGVKTIFKIKVIPKRNSQQLMKGYLYIVDKLWCLHSADASVQMFFGTLNYRTIFSPIKEIAWLPISYRFDVDASILGMKLAYRYTSAVKYQQVLLNDKTRFKPAVAADPVLSEQPPASKTDLKDQKNAQILENLIAKEELTNRDMMKMARLMASETKEDTSETKSLEVKEENNRVVTVEKDAMKNDTVYWNVVRPIPLTAIEATIAPGRDSLVPATDTLTVKKDPAKRDTGRVKKLHPLLNKAGNFIINGAGFRMFNKTLQVHYDGLIGLRKFDFNTVDGFIYRQLFSLEQKIDSSHRLKIDPGIAYTFSRRRIMWWADAYYDYAPMRAGNIRFHIGSESADFNTETGINTTINSLSSLFFRRNYLKLFQQNQAFLTNRIELANGLNLSVTAGYRTAQPLANHSDYSFFYRESREYSANVPTEDSLETERNVYHEEAWWDVQLEFTPRNYYKVQDGRKHYQYSKYPTFFIRNRMAVPGIVHSTADYDLLEAGVRMRTEWGMMHTFSWAIKGGIFLNRNKVFMTDDKYFNVQNLPVALVNVNDAFRLLPLYENATNRSFAEAHVTFSTPYLVVKYLPFLSNKMWRENLHLNYLTAKNQQNYWEIGYSISQIYLVGSVGVFAGFKDLTYNSFGIQVSIEL